MKRSTKGVLFVRNIHPEVKKMFKGACYRRGDTISEVVESLMRLYVRNQKAGMIDLIKVKQARKELE